MSIEALIGVKPLDWEVETLGALCRRGGGDIQTGPFGSQLHARDYVEDGVPSIMPQNIGDNRVRIEAVARVKEEDAHRLARYRVRTGDIVYSRRGDVERRALIRSEEDGWLCGTGCLRVRVGKSVDPRYAAYYLGHPSVRQWIVNHAVGATMPNLNTSILSALPVLVPPLGEQRRIAEILGALDDKIELNGRMNESLGAIAHILFDELLAHSASDWEARRLGDYVSLQRGTTYKSTLKGQPGPYLLGLGSIRRNGGFRGDKLETYGGDSPDSLLLRPGDIYVSLKDVTQSGDLLGAVARVPPSVAVGRLTQDTVKLVPLDADAPMEIIYRTLLSESYREYCRAHATGTTNLGLSRDDFLAYPIVCPPHDLRAKFDEQVGVLNRRMELADQESRTLAQLRDTLLPKLLSGEIRVATAEKELATHV